MRIAAILAWRLAFDRQARPCSNGASSVGTWRSLVAYLNGVQGVPGSNPGVPTKFPEQNASVCLVGCLFSGSSENLSRRREHRSTLPPPRDAIERPSDVRGLDDRTSPEHRRPLVPGELQRDGLRNSGRHIVTGG